MGARKRKIYVRWLALLAPTALALYVCWLMLLPFVNVLAWAAVLVILFYPIHQRIVALMGRPSWSALLSTVIVISVILIPLTMYYLFRDGDWIYNAMLQVIPLEPAQTRRVFNRMREVIHASVYGVIMIAVIQGTLGGLAFAVLGLPSALVWGVVMFFMSMIPLVGSSLVWFPAAVYLAVSGHWGKALALAAWGALVIGTIDNFMRPKLVGERTGLHELLIFFSVLGGLRIWGALGLVLGPVVIAITLALLDIFKQMTAAGREIERVRRPADG